MSGFEPYITPAILVALILFVWRDLSRHIDRVEKTLGGRIDRVEKTLGGRIDRINDRLDRHLEGHPAHTPS